MVHRAHKIELKVSNREAARLRQWCGISRFVYNQGLELWNKMYTAGEKPSFYSVNNRFNAIKREAYPFVLTASKWVAAAALQDLDKGFKAFYKHVAEHPIFHKRGVHDSFRIDGSVISIEDKLLKLPKKLTLRLKEPFRFEKTCNKIYNVTVSYRAGRWFASIACSIEVSVCENQGAEPSNTANKEAVGIDMGVKTLATLSDGTKINNPKVYRTREKRHKHLQRALVRKKRGSRNRRKAKDLLARYDYRTACMRHDWQHKHTSAIAKTYPVVFVEDLNVSGMEKNHCLAKSIADASMSSYITKLSYKTNVYKIDRFEPSSKTCSRCGSVQEMPLNKRTYECPNCGAVIDRDLNAAINILHVGVANYPELMPVEGAKRSVKQESTIGCNSHPSKN